MFNLLALFLVLDLAQKLHHLRSYWSFLATLNETWEGAVWREEGSKVEPLGFNKSNS